MHSDLLSADEAASILHLKVSTIRSWILHRRLAYVKLGRRIFLRKSDLMNLIERSVVPAKSPRDGAAATDGRI
jgi:excisionase family DNA binding protein